VAASCQLADLRGKSGFTEHRKPTLAASATSRSHFMQTIDAERYRQQGFLHLPTYNSSIVEDLRRDARRVFLMQVRVTGRRSASR
jgi:hypothetical protein